MPLLAETLPPRTALPRDVRIPVLPALGDTWYDRGPRYWARRAGVTLMWVVVLALLGSFGYGLFSGIRHSSRTGFAVVLAVDLALTVALLLYSAVRTARLWNTAALPGEVSVVFPARKRKSTGLSGFAQFAYRVAVLAAAVVFLVFPGFFILLFLTSLMPEMPSERHARLWMAERLRERGLDAPAT
jgi:hypothetical protein